MKFDFEFYFPRSISCGYSLRTLSGIFDVSIGVLFSLCYTLNIQIKNEEGVFPYIEREDCRKIYKKLNEK